MTQLPKKQEGNRYIGYMLESGNKKFNRFLGWNGHPDVAANGGSDFDMSGRVSVFVT